ENPHFVKSALSRFTPNDFIERLDQHNIKYEEKLSGQMFCRGSSRSIIGMLVNKCKHNGVSFLFNSTISSIQKTDCFAISVNNTNIESKSLVVATGGPSYPEIGGSDYGLNIAKQFEIGIIEIRAALVPLIFNPKDTKHFSQLSGISFSGSVSCGKHSFLGDILFTHRGLTGPAILQISSYWRDGKTLLIDIAPGKNIFSEILEKRTFSGKMLLRTFFSQYIRKSFASTWCEKHGLTESLHSYSEKELQRICSNLHKWKVVPAGTESYKRAHAMKGGVDTREISSKTMESQKVKDLYFIGEVLDVVGHLGGYNLQWAWSSGFAAGQCV
ncbi:MAG: aminoacetone oxidase family FAD-binding enzyme, partial [Deltaproteobacteria bacterium]|nr:aminoacetone oxidase family FAD-binding enzyme [Deltaproteobacteria bacterium]